MSLLGLFAFCVQVAPVALAPDAYSLRRLSGTPETDILSLWEQQASEDHKVKLDVWESSLLPFFLSMPKNEAGRLGIRGARFVLHRVFVKRFGWHIRGLALEYDDSKDYKHAFADAGDDWILNISQRIFQTEGAGIRDVALLAFAFEESIRRNTADRLRAGYKIFKLSMDAPLPTKLAEVALFYFFDGLLGVEPEISNLTGDQDEMQRIAARYVQLRLSQIETDDIRAVRYFRSFGSWMAGNNANYMMTFSEVADVALNVLKHFSNYNGEVCTDLRHELLRHDVDNVGRISLAHFYSIVEAPQFRFSESLQYLKAAGAIDDTQSQNPKVILINYIQSSANCLHTGDRISFCCRSACYDVLHELEFSILEPSARPHRIIEVLSRMSTSQMKIPAVNISNDLLRKLDEIAETNLGRVPLHGRLFAQWLHHVFPHECTYPTSIFAAGWDGGPDPDEWTLQTGISVEEKKEAINGIVNSSVCPIPGRTIPPVAPPWCNDKSISWDLAEHLPFQFEPRPRVRGILSLSFAVASVVATLCALLERLWRLGRFGDGRRVSKLVRAGSADLHA